MYTEHTFNDGYYCKCDGVHLNDKADNRKNTYCEVLGTLKTCDECMYFGKKEN